MPALSPIPIPFWAWAAFIALVVVVIAFDLGLFHRRSREIPFREAAGWMGVWLAAAVLFGLVLLYWLGREPATQFAAGCLIEFSLSLDNIFVIALLFAYLRIPSKEQHRVLFWGVAGALLMRGVLIGVGSALIARYEWMLYFLGAFLVLTGGKMLFSRSAAANPEKNLVLRLARRLFPVSDTTEGRAFFTRVNGRRALTPLAIALILVETSDLVFALDSIPAVFAVTTNTFLVFTSNVFAVCMLRTLFYLLAGAIRYFRHLKTGLAVVLMFIGAKMLLRTPPHGLRHWYHHDISTADSLLVVGTILVLAVLLSLIHPAPGSPPAPRDPP